MDKHLFRYGENHLTAGVALNICNGKLKGIITTATQQKIQKNKNVVNRIINKGKLIYGLNTGFGPLCTTLISTEETKKLQENLLKSHSVGVGKPVDSMIAKLMMILKVHVLAKAHSGISVSTLKRIIFHIENDIIPLVPSQGSVGASGDLTPLAHLFLPLLGLGEVCYKNKTYATAEILKMFKLKPIKLAPKEGLALLNGTQFMTAYAVVILKRVHNCLVHADICAAMMLDALAGSIKPFHRALHKVRPHKGCVFVAENISKFLENSEILKAHVLCGRVQDPYSLRCIPQVHGASRNAFLHLKECLNIELNSITDNPIIFNEDLVLNGGNFHGQPIALPLDYVGLATSELGNISDRRIFLSLDSKVDNIPKLLMKETGLNSGFMILQYTSAALASENKSLCYPASADSISTSLNQEDHVSMGPIAARKTLQIIKNVEKILAIELLCAAQALDFQRPLKSSPFIEDCHKYIRTKVSYITKDLLFYREIDKVLDIIQSEKLAEIEENHFKHHFKHQFKNKIFEIY